MLSSIRPILICLIVFFLAYTASSLYRSGYNNGKEDCRAETTIKLKQIRDANEAAVNSAQISLLSKIENLQGENARLADEIKKIDKISNNDPNANTCGISISSVRRLKAIH